MADSTPESGEGKGARRKGDGWPAVDGVDGPARGKRVLPPHKRHYLHGVKGGRVRAVNSVVLRGYETAVDEDVKAVAEGGARWNPQTNRYEVNGRSYGVEEHQPFPDAGTRAVRLFPDTGLGITQLDRNEYAALKELAKAGGDWSLLPRSPRFTENPEAVERAAHIYEGGYG